MDASDAYLRATLIWREEILGCRLFDVFPDNPHNATADGVQNLRASLHQVLQRGKPHRMALQRYDVRDHVAGDGAWVEKFWAPMNTPVYGSGSREITHVLHQVEDVTQAVFLHQRLAAMLQAWITRVPAMAALQRKLGVPDTRPYWGPGHGAPVDGIYTVFHQRACGSGPRMVYMPAGWAFRRCLCCQEGVLYRLTSPLR